MAIIAHISLSASASLPQNVFSRSPRPPHQTHPQAKEERRAGKQTRSKKAYGNKFITSFDQSDSNQSFQKDLFAYELKHMCAMKSAEFEEKEYEAVLYDQLEGSRANVWSPGQVFEEHIGIDRAMFVNSPRIWRTLGRAMTRGVFLNRYDWSPIWRHRSKRALPNFRLNLFIQAKRPSFGKRLPKHIYNAGLAAPGWCFTVDDHQQRALEKLASRFNNRASIIYAAPAFHTVLQLFAHTRKVSVVENSTFPDVARLRRHSKWFYNQPGGDGVANPEAEFSRGPSLDETIEKLRASQEGTQNANASINLRDLAKTIFSAFQDEELADNPRVAGFLQEIEMREREISNIEVLRDEVRSFYQVAAFAEWFNVEWFTIS